MEVIPVIDVLGGVAVAARAGDRETYLPLSSPLVPDSDPVCVARGFGGMFSFQGVYVADLDAIERRGGNPGLVANVSGALLGAQVWVDCGVGQLEAALEVVERCPQALVVVGSESVGSVDDLERLVQGFGERGLGERVVLSLDFQGEQFAGPEAVLARPDVWPSQVIAMTLGVVGMGAGPDVARVHQICGLAGGRKVFAAGGIRNVEDCRVVREAGASGVLIASALHRETIKAGDLDEIAGL